MNAAANSFLRVRKKEMITYTEFGAWEVYECSSLKVSVLYGMIDRPLSFP